VISAHTTHVRQSHCTALHFLRVYYRYYMYIELGKYAMLKVSTLIGIHWLGRRISCLVQFLWASAPDRSNKVTILVFVGVEAFRATAATGADSAVGPASTFAATNTTTTTTTSKWRGVARRGKRRRRTSSLLVGKRLLSCYCEHAEVVDVSIGDFHERTRTAHP
jgi:hypothetical protein